MLDDSCTLRDSIDGGDLDVALQSLEIDAERLNSYEKLGGKQMLDIFPGGFTANGWPRPSPALQVQTKPPPKHSF